MTLAHIFLALGLLCSSMSIAYSFAGHDKRSRRQSTVWLKRMFLFGGVGLLLLLAVGR